MERSIIYLGKKIFYRSIGNGKPVMLVHGFGEDGNVWNPLLTSPKGGEITGTQAAAIENTLLNKGFRFIIPDLPGSGKSEMIADMSMEGMAEALHSIIHEENIDECTVIGHSMGGYITLALVESYWNHVIAFGLFHSTAFPDTDEKKETRKKGIEFIKQHGAFEFLKTTTPNLFSPTTKEQNPDLVSSFIETLKDFKPAALIAYYNAMMARPDRTHILKNTKNPVLFIAGEHDNAIPLNDVLKQCHLPEKSYFHVLKKSGHMGMMEETETA
ncbi:MAG TPA: alpha/beta hydrolase, partial [Chitinophagaceae bacterium]